MSPKPSLFLVAVCCLSALGAGARALAAPPAVSLSLEEALRLAQAHSPALRASEARVAEADARARSAGLQPNPTLNIAHGAGHDAAGLDEDVIVAQTVELPGKVRPRIRSARASQKAAVSDEAGARLELEFTVRSSYFEALRAEGDRRLAADALATAKTFEEAAQTRFEAGDVARSNVLRSGIETARARQALEAAEADLANRAAALRSLTGLPSDTPLVLADPLGAQTDAYDLPQLQALAIAHRPDVAAAESRVLAAGAEVSVARSASRPDLFVEGRRAAIIPYRNLPNGYSVRAGIALPLVDFGRNRSDVAAARAAFAEQQAGLDEATRAARLDVETAYNTYATAKTAVESFSAGRLDRARELLTMTQTGYQHGASSYLELLDAQQAFRAEQAEYTRALADLNIARAALRRAVGGTLP